MPVGALGTSNRVQVSILEEGLFPLNFGVKQTGNGQILDVTGESLKFDLTFTQSKVLRPDRQVAGNTPTGATAGGAINIEHRYAGLDPLLRSIVGNDFLPYGVSGVGAAVDVLTFTSTTILTATTAPTAASAFTTLRKGQWFSLIAPAGASAAVKVYLGSRAFRVSGTVSPTATVLTLDAATPVDTSIMTAPVALAKVSSAYLVNGTSMWSFNVEVGHEDVLAYRQYLGMIPGKLSLKIGDTDLITGSIDFVGKTMVNPIPTVTGMGTRIASPSYQSASGVRGIFDIIENGVSISASTYIKSMDLMVDGSLRVQNAVGVLGAARIAPGTFKVSGTLEVYFADVALYNRFLSNSKTSLSLPILDELGNGYVYHICKATYTAAEVSAGGMDQDTMLKITFTGEIDDNAASPTFGKTIAVYRVGAAV